MIFSRKSRKISSTMRKEREHAQRTREHTELIFQKINICEYTPMIHFEPMIESSIAHAFYRSYNYSCTPPISSAMNQFNE